MSTPPPMFTGNEEVFKYVTTFVSRTDPRFGSFLAAINSSASLRQELLTFQAANGYISSSSADNEPGHAMQGALYYERSTHVIQISEDYWTSPPAVNNGFFTGTPKWVLGEQIRVLSHELSHANRAIQVKADEDRVIDTWNDTIRNRVPTIADKSAYVAAGLRVGLENEARAYVDN